MSQTILTTKTKEKEEQNHKQKIESLLKTAQGFAIDASDKVVEIIELVINYALAEKASDLHLEPLRNDTAVRFRIDGILHTVLNFPKQMHSALVSRFKILGDLKIDEYRRPQDGRIEIGSESDVSLRISTVPTLYGEKVALRILGGTEKNFALNDLGFTPDQIQILLRNIEKPFGMIVTSGPTGSGKTTTLYALLDLLKKGNVNISTLEDPVEYSMPGVNQIQINPRVDLSFASGLRALLRQDPDIIMVGEIRDSETGVMAANAALTGHLVFTTMHTNDASSVFTRFLEMKIEDFVVGSIVNLVIAQRLVRKTCTSCAVEGKLDPVILEKILERKDILAALKNHGVTSAKLASTNFLAGRGCKECLQTGYSGRIGLHELLELNKEIHDLILQHAPAEKIKAAAIRSGFKDIIENGVDKIFSGLTTFDEVLRVTKNV